MRLIAHGDVSAALLAVTERSPVDLLWGIGGTPEGVISAAAIKCLGGQLLGPAVAARRAASARRRWRPGMTSSGCSTRDDLVAGDDVFFSATGITDGDVLQGVRYPSAGGATTESLVMRTRSGTVRRISATHDRAKLRAVARRAASSFRVHGASPAVRRHDQAPRSGPTARLGQVQARERAQEAVRDEHVDARLRGVVEAAAEARGDRRIEVRHLDLDVQARPRPGPRRGQAAHVDLQVAAAVWPAPRDQQPRARCASARPRGRASISYSGAREGEQPAAVGTSSTTERSRSV